MSNQGKPMIYTSLFFARIANSAGLEAHLLLNQALNTSHFIIDQNAHNIGPGLKLL
jgi:hypothetical protein